MVETQVAKLNRKQTEAYKNWKAVKQQIADLESETRKLKKIKENFEEGFVGGLVDNQAYMGKVLIVREKKDRHVDAYDYSFFQYAEKIK